MVAGRWLSAELGGQIEDRHAVGGGRNFGGRDRLVAHGPLLLDRRADVRVRRVQGVGHQVAVVRGLVAGAHERDDEVAERGDVARAAVRARVGDRADVVAGAALRDVGAVVVAVQVGGRDGVRAGVAGRDDRAVVRTGGPAGAAFARRVAVEERTVVVEHEDEVFRRGVGDRDDEPALGPGHAERRLARREGERLRHIGAVDRAAELRVHEEHPAIFVVGPLDRRRQLAVVRDDDLGRAGDLVVGVRGEGGDGAIEQEAAVAHQVVRVDDGGVLLATEHVQVRSVVAEDEADRGLATAEGDERGHEVELLVDEAHLEDRDRTAPEVYGRDAVVLRGGSDTVAVAARAALAAGRDVDERLGELRVGVDGEGVQAVAVGIVRRGEDHGGRIQVAEDRGLRGRIVRSDVGLDGAPAAREEGGGSDGGEDRGAQRVELAHGNSSCVLCVFVSCQGISGCAPGSIRSKHYFVRFVKYTLHYLVSFSLKTAFIVNKRV